MCGPRACRNNFQGPGAACLASSKPLRVGHLCNTLLLMCGTELKPQQRASLGTTKPA
jgi:hypothetical protein